MKRLILIYFANNLLSDLIPRVNISLADEIFLLQLDIFFLLILKRKNIPHTQGKVQNDEHKRIISNISLKKKRIISKVLLKKKTLDL